MYNTTTNHSMSLIQKTPTLLKELVGKTYGEGKNIYHADADSCKGWTCPVHGQYCPPGKPGSGKGGYCCVQGKWKPGKCTTLLGKDNVDVAADKCTGWKCKTKDQYCPPGRLGSTSFKGAGYVCKKNTDGELEWQEVGKCMTHVDSFGPKDYGDYHSKAGGWGNVWYGPRRTCESHQSIREGSKGYTKKECCRTNDQQTGRR